MEKIKTEKDEIKTKADEKGKIPQINIEH